jgi:ABC-type uncharacterized transport system permease subunit
VAIGGLFGFILAALVVTYRMDQIIAGVVINLFVLGLTSYVSSQVFAEIPLLNNAPVFRSWKIPMLGDIPVIGPMLFNQNLFVYGALVMVASRPTTSSTPGRAARPRGRRTSARRRHAGHRCLPHPLPAT